MLFKLTFLLLLATNSLCHDDDVHTIKLTKDNWSDTEKANYFVMFFAPWCGHCQRLAPTWEQLAEAKNTKDDANVKIAKVDCTTDAELCTAQEVTGYPTLKFFKTNSEPVKFRGARDLSSLTSFVNEQLGDKENNLIDDEETVEVPKPVSTLVELTEDTFAQHISSGKHLVKFYAPWCGHCQKLAPTWDELAKSLEHDKSISISKIDCTEYRPICNDFDVKGYPTLLWIEDGKKIEKYSGARGLADLKTYVDKMSGNSKHGAADKDDAKVGAGEKDNTSVVIHLTKTDFEHATEKGVTFVKFFAPWCGHCKRMAPTWEQLAEKFVGNKQVKIAKVDCTLENSKVLCSEQDVNGFPTIFIYKNGEKVSEYNGSRSLEDLHDFVTRQLGEHDEL